MKGPVIFLVVLNLCVCLARVPSRNHETEATAVENRPKDDQPVEAPVERTPIESLPANEQPSTLDRPFHRKPVGVILIRQQPSISLFGGDRSPNPFAFQPSLLDHSHFHNFHNGNPQDDPALRLISLLFGRNRPMQPEPAETEAVNASSESSVESSEGSRRDYNPMDSLFPHLFPRFPIDDEPEKEGEASTSNEEKTPANFENKEKKVINIGGRKFVKTTQVKKVKNDFGQFHSVISSYQPFDESIHDENGNEKVKPGDSTDEKVDKKDVDSSTATSDKVDSSVDVAPSSTTSTAAPEREESTSKSSVEPAFTSSQKEPEKLKLPSESLSKEQNESKMNEISDKNVEIKVDQMN